VSIGLVDRFRPTFWFTIFCFSAIGLFVALGYWQVERLEWKTDLIQQMTNRADQAPAPLPNGLSDPKNLRFMPVKLTGQWVPDATIVLRPRTLDGRAGGHIATPLKLRDGRVVMVNRGWIADEKISNHEINLPMAGPVTVMGVIRLWPDDKPAFVPDNRPHQGGWHWWDQRKLQEMMDINLAPVLIYQTGQDVSKNIIPHDPAPDLPNNHRNYAIFWFTMAGITLILWGVKSWDPS
jgi:surfeit locus 1 family protein